jgi:hypothetical protein
MFGFMENKIGSQYYEQEPDESLSFGSQPPYNVQYGSINAASQRKEWPVNALVAA